MSKKRVILIFASAAFILFILAAAGFGIYFMNPADRTGEEQVVIVSEGMSLNQVAVKLERLGIIRSSDVFRILARVRGYSRMIKAGEYSLGPAMEPGKILEILTRGVVLTHSVTLPEGLSIYQIADILSERGLTDREKFLSIAESGDYIKTYGIDAPSLEGYLYPDTYRFARGLPAETVVRTMVNRFMDAIEPLRDSISSSGMRLEDIIILASIVEKETGMAYERPLVAGVFHNRIRKGMRLDSDPTVIYGIEGFTGRLTRRDLTTYTPYNTYMIRSLPPGPIANPGFESIKAVLEPAETDYLFFVSRNDGSHHFSRTLSEHNRAVNKYQRSPKRNQP